MSKRLFLQRLTRIPAFVPTSRSVEIIQLGDIMGGCEERARERQAGSNSCEKR